MRTLEDLQFSNSFAGLSSGFRTRRNPLAEPHLIGLSPAAAGLIVEVFFYRGKYQQPPNPPDGGRGIRANCSS
jgi:hypothetical protein